MNYASNVTGLIGKTPLVKLQQASEETGCLILAKCEFMNPNGSIKDRIGYAMIEDALERKVITKDSILVEPTSGNTGIGLAAVCAAYGIELHLTMPSSMSVERRNLLKQLGAKIVLTEPSLGMKGAIDKAQEIKETEKNIFIPSQFSNPANPLIHEKTTAIEILDDTDSKVDVFVAAVGTGGTITGVGKVLKDFAQSTIVAVEPDSSAVLSGGSVGPHKIQGIGAGFVPDVLEMGVVDEVVQVSYENALVRARALAKKEGLLVGISAGANIEATVLYAKKHGLKDKVLVTILPDTGERYMSTELFGDDVNG